MVTTELTIWFFSWTTVPVEDTVERLDPRVGRWQEVGQKYGFHQRRMRDFTWAIKNTIENTIVDRSLGIILSGLMGIIIHINKPQ